MTSGHTYTDNAVYSIFAVHVREIGFFRTTDNAQSANSIHLPIVKGIIVNALDIIAQCAFLR
jgi:hypothetical protein